MTPTAPITVALVDDYDVVLAGYGDSTLVAEQACLSRQSRLFATAVLLNR